MAETISTTDLDKEAKKLKRDLEGWREVILQCNSVLTWNKQSYPIILVSAISFTFLLLWYLDPSIVTGFSIFGLIVTLIDYLVPTFAHHFFNSDTWTGAKEKQFEGICKTIAASKMLIGSKIKTFYNWRFERPKLFYLVTVVDLLFFAYIGNSINNLFLTYLVVILVVLYPGLKNNDLFQKYTKGVTGLFKTLSSSIIKDETPKKTGLNKPKL